MNEIEFKELIKRAAPADSSSVQEALKRQALLAKPPKSLGKLEDISVKLAGITGKVVNEIKYCRVLVFSADNGVVTEGVASTPQSVTLKQSINMLRHKTGMSALAEYFGDSVMVIDVGIKSGSSISGIVDRKIRPGTYNIRKGPAMTRDEAVKALSIGIEAVNKARTDGIDAVGIGEMGIGNTTTSSAVLSVLAGLDAELVTGRGSGLTDDAFQLKKDVIRDAVRVNSPDRNDVIDVIAKVGGFDIAAMTGAFIGCALHRMPGVVDGFISIVAALCAVRLCPAVKDHIFLSHASEEIGYKAAADALGLEPFLKLDMRLGEGSGCPIAFRVMQAACAVMRNMATFDEASIDDAYLDGIRGTFK